MKSVLALALFCVAATPAAFAQTAVSKADNWIRCEGIKDEVSSPGKVMRGVKVFVQLFTVDKETQQVIPSQKVDSEEAWFGDDLKLRTTAIAKCKATVAKYSCDFGAEYSQIQGRAESVKKYRDVDLVSTDGKDRQRFDGSDGWTSFWSGSAMTRCRRAIVDFGINAMAEEAGIASARAKAANEKAYREAFDKALEGNANKR